MLNIRSPDILSGNKKGSNYPPNSDHLKSLIKRILESLALQRYTQRGVKSIIKKQEGILQ
ncbi:hypothetical protein V6B95_12395 [Thermoanaerobacterium saccharolyticum]|uniref:hypothetical protein n=1 Tax=Thermoanaerobacterium saccharolyticum TaxID=28896 RepID=UPI002FDB372C